eukprot:CAMPEP_0206006848 /NCGR_PEP_ID=MMETSP1464-20131121/5412_1 /ASSEMBLY_ACC=CAM_ASM_001124 /TAXON_ID=119497 /ORGANISM="Exanthemachrysis gayraliae, Strain RCC1523" /LENGTH=375 /DNA_ID=CAMNT_0053380333 /DNA_START=374 /DNA_END=1497 /DNA_ORIENTATION=+
MRVTRVGMSPHQHKLDRFIRGPADRHRRSVIHQPRPKAAEEASPSLVHHDSLCGLEYTRIHGFQALRRRQGRVRGTRRHRLHPTAGDRPPDTDRVARAQLSCGSMPEGRAHGGLIGVPHWAEGRWAPLASANVGVALGLQAGLDHIEGRCGRRGSDPRAGACDHEGAHSVGAVGAHVAPEQLVCVSHHSRVRQVHEESHPERPVEGPEALVVRDAPHAAEEATVLAQLHPLLDHVHGRHYGVVPDRGDAYRDGRAHGVVVHGRARSQSRLERLVHREVGRMRRDAADEHRPRALPRREAALGAELLQAGNDARVAFARGTVGGPRLQARLHGIYREHDEVLSQTRKASRDHMLEQGPGGRVPFVNVDLDRGLHAT